MKKMKIKLADKNACSGCGACCDACPTKSVHLRFDSNLFGYPIICRDTCIRCGKCVTVCSGLDDLTKKNDNFTQLYYCAWSNDQVIRKRSTSGGVGSALALTAIENGYYVCGAAFDNNFNLAHIISNKLNVIEKICGSKYLQSNTEGIYHEIRTLLKNGEKVLFFGTPCQAEALRRVTPSSMHNNLLICAIICHGVNSPVVWKDFKDDLEKRYHSFLGSYNFRSKAHGWGKLVVEYSLKNGKRIVQIARKNLFHVWFGQHLILRDSCFYCKFRNEKRNSDLTIGDFWGIEKVMPGVDNSEGVSVLIISSNKGQAFVDQCETHILKHRVDTHDTVAVLKGFVTRPGAEMKFTRDLEGQKKFIERYCKHSFQEMKRMYPCPSFISLVVSFLKSKLKIK